MATKKKALPKTTTKVQRINMPVNIDADGQTNNQLYTTINSWCDEILLNTERGQFILHSDEEGVEPTPVPSAIRQVVYNMVAGLLGGKSLSFDGAVLWLADERVKTSAPFQELVNGSYSVIVNGIARGGTTRVDFTPAQAMAVLDPKAEIIGPMAEQYPFPRQTKGTKKSAVRQEEVLWDFGLSE